MRMDSFNNLLEIIMIIREFDIVKSVNSIISDYIKDGYMISPFTMAGSYSGAESFIDLIKYNDNSHVIRIWICNGFTNQNDSYMNTKNIRIKCYKNDIHYKCDINHIRTLWPDSGELLNEIKFYKIADRDDCNIYTDSFNEAIEYRNISINRHYARHNSPFRKEIALDKLPRKFVNNIMNRIHNTRGFKRASNDCINKVTVLQDGNRFRSTVYYSFNGKSGVINLH